ncbi:SLC13 family permease [uncultured Alistipes sp.]|jgi:potassium uptake protein, trk family|uniref:SLC13 family permease n=1 Tax=uncultured Alistipes sp. TaxID=538949 RepID=UPI0025D17D23|nr:SLC13 family permease [uncultured Alistipes sp.]
MNIAGFFTPDVITLTVLTIAAVCFMSGKVRTDITAMCALLALLLTEVLNPAEALQGFSSNVVIMMVGLFIVGAGIFRTGLAKMIGSKILKVGGHNENVLFILVMLVTAGIGAFVSNTGTVAVMMPIVVSMAASAGISSRRFLMPMAFASGMGMFTLISTPPNLVIQDILLSNPEYEPLKFFSFAPVGTIAVITGVGFLFIFSKQLKSKNENTGEGKKRIKSLSELVEEYNVDMTMYKMPVPEGSPIVGKRINELKIATTYLVSISKILSHPSNVRLIRQSTEKKVTPDTEIEAGDTLYCHGSVEHIEKFVEDFGLQATPVEKQEAGSLMGDSGLSEVFIMPNSRLINNTVRGSRFRELYNVNVLGIKRQGEDRIGEFKDVKMHAGDALLIQGTWEQIAALDSIQDDLVVVGQPEKEAAKVTLDRKAPLAAMIMLAMIVVMVLDIVPAVAAVLTAAILMVITGCLRNMEEAYDSINWNSVVLIAAMIPMSTAFEKTGITASISSFLTNGLGDISPLMLLAVVYFCTSLLTMFLSNTATAVLFAPIAMKVALEMDANPKPFLFAVAVAASMCFASPFSTPPNAMVMSAGHYTTMDYVRVGLPLQIIMGIIMVLALPLLFPFH